MSAPLRQRMHSLLAEDNEDHALITQRALRQAQPEIAEQLVITAVSDGAEALAFLERALAEGPGAADSVPDLILLDLKMPGVGGLDVLRAIRADPRLTLVPVIVLTTSARDEDITEAYRLRANGYVTKPVGAEEFRSKVQSIPQYWSKIMARPPRGGAYPPAGS